MAEIIRSGAFLQQCWSVHPLCLTVKRVEPERIVVDSDLDWGQDIKRLGQRLRELKAAAVASCSLISASTTPRSSGVVSLMLAGSPWTTVTAWPVAATS